MAAKFQTTIDGKAFDWSLSLNVGMLARLRTEAGFEIGRDSEKLAGALFADPETIAKVLWVLIEQQAKAAGISPESFAFSLDGDAIESATTALMEAIINFYHRQIPRATMMERLPGILAKVDQQVVKAINEATEPLKTCAGNSPESSESTAAN